LLALCANVINSETPLFFWEATHHRYWNPLLVIARHKPSSTPSSFL
jgi:hypothetical protein